MFTALIIDDETHFAVALKKNIELNCPNILIIGTQKSVEEGVSFIKEHKPDLIFLDIEMPKENGFTLFKHFDKPHFDVIFTTAHSGYTIEAIRHSALDYLLKPINKQELATAVNRFVEKRQIQTSEKVNNLLYNLDVHVLAKQRVAIPVGHAYEFVEFSQIIRAEATDNYTEIYLINNKKILATKSLNLVDNLLPEGLFFRVHRSHIISINHIKTYLKKDGGVLMMSDGTQLPIAISKKDELLTKLHLSF